jgi:hypothetical protein
VRACAYTPTFVYVKTSKRSCISSTSPHMYNLWFIHWKGSWGWGEKNICTFSLTSFNYDCRQKPQEDWQYPWLCHKGSHKLSYHVTWQEFHTSQNIIYTHHFFKSIKVFRPAVRFCFLMHQWGNTAISSPKFILVIVFSIIGFLHNLVYLNSALKTLFLVYRLLLAAKGLWHRIKGEKSASIHRIT